MYFMQWTSFKFLTCPVGKPLVARLQTNSVTNVSLKALAFKSVLLFRKHGNLKNTRRAPTLEGDAVTCFFFFFPASSLLLSPISSHFHFPLG